MAKYKDEEEMVDNDSEECAEDGGGIDSCPKFDKPNNKKSKAMARRNYVTTTMKKGKKLVKDVTKKIKAKMESEERPVEQEHRNVRFL